MNTQNHPTFASLDPVRQKLAVDKARQRIADVREMALPHIEALSQELAWRRQRREMREQLPPIFKSWLQPMRYKGAHGGRGSSKSHSVATMLLDRCLDNPGTRWACIREVQKSLEQSVKRLLEDQIEKFNLGKKFKVLNTHIVTPGDGILLFQGMQNHTADSIKSLEGFHGAWVEEAQSLSEKSLELLRPTIRTAMGEIWFTWNPKKATDPVDKLLRGAVTPPDSLVIEVNYRDNPYFPETLRKELEWDQNRDPEKFNHIWLGQYERKGEARVFKNYIVDDFETPDGTDFLYGGDWGYAVDPSVLIRGYIVGRTLFIDREAYQVGCEIDHTPALFDTLDGGLARKYTITTDSARPETISYMQRHGYPGVVGAKKGPGSIEEGINFLKNYDIVIHRRCIHVADEFSMYSHKTHPLTGQVLPALEDKKNHTIDAARYMVEPIRNPGADWITW